MTTRTRSRRLGAGLIILFAAYVVWLGVAIVRFSPPPAVSRAGRAGGPPYEIVGVYHVHSKFSDGHAAPEEIAAAAAGRKLDFIILTDHGNPNRRSLESQGRKDGVLILAGSELSVSRGHLVALDFAPPERPFPQTAERAAFEVAAQGGFTIVAHPYSKTSWTWGEGTDFSGIELVDADSMVKRNWFRWLPYLPALPLMPSLPLVKALSRPVKPLEKWDSLAAGQAVYGYFSADAHLLYSVIFGCFRMHVLLEEPLAQDFERAKAQVFGALRGGRFYNAVDGAAPAGGFEFSAETGGARFPMGSSVPWDGASAVRLDIRVPFTFPVETCLIRNGELIGRAREAELSYATDKPGVYRVEVYLRTRSPLAADFPWIVSNPIFLKRS
jgi:PHP domain